MAAALFALVGGVAHAQQSVELQQNNADKLRASGLYADTYYNGGYAGNNATSGPLTGNASYGPGPTLGFTFSTNAAILQAGAMSTQGRFQNLPTDPVDGNTQVLSFNNSYPTAITNVINFVAGFTEVAFNYSLANNDSTYDQTVDIWSGLNGTGTLVGTIQLTPGTLQSTQQLNSATTATSFAPTHQYPFTGWATAKNDNLSAIAESVTFGTSTTLANEELEIDAFTVEEVPEPSTWALLIAGLALSFALRRRSLRA